MSDKGEQNESPLISPNDPEQVNEVPIQNETLQRETEADPNIIEPDVKPKRHKIIILSLITLSGILTITLSSYFSFLIQATLLSLLYIFGSFLSSPVFALFFEVYHCFIPPFYPDICRDGRGEEKVYKDQTEKADAGD